MGGAGARPAGRPISGRAAACTRVGGKGRGLSVRTEGGRCEDPGRVRRAGDPGAGWGLGRVRAWAAAHGAGARARTRAVARLTELRDEVGRSEGPRTGLGRWPSPARWRGRRGHCCHGNTCVRTGYLSLPPTPHRTCAHLKLPLCPPPPQMASIIRLAGWDQRKNNPLWQPPGLATSQLLVSSPPSCRLVRWQKDSARPGAT